MGIQHVITLVHLETVDQLTDLLYVFGIYIMTCCKMSCLIRSRDKVSNMLDGLNGLFRLKL